MRWTSILAIYILFWTMSLFLVLPFGVRTPEEAGEACPPGHAESAPHVFRFGRVVVRASLVAAVFTALYVANYIYGWITVEDLDWVN
jgi:predicted secreted protein